MSLQGAAVGGKRAPRPNSEAAGDVLTVWGMTAGEATLPPEAQKSLRDTRGLVVVGVAPGSQASGAGVVGGEVIAEVNNEKTRNLRDLRNVLARHDPYEPLCVFLINGEIWRFITLPSSSPRLAHTFW